MRQTDHSLRGKTVLFLGPEAPSLLAFRGPLMQFYREAGYHVVAAADVPVGFEIEQFRQAGIHFLLWPLARAALNPLADIKSIIKLWKLMRQERPEILFASTIKPVIYGLLLARLAGVNRRAVMVPGLGYAFTDGGGLKRVLAGFIARVGYRMALSQAHIVIFQNPDDLAALRGAGVLPAEVPSALVNGSGVDMTHYSPGQWSSGPPRFLMVARLLSDKGVREFASAARIVRLRFPEAKFVLVGGADSNPAAIPQSEVEEWVKEGLIDARGHLADPRAEYAACHVHVLPSYREGTPRSNLEAMAMARAIITTDVPGCRETVIDGRNGLLVQVRDPQSLAEAMITLAGDLPRARAMGEEGRRFCSERFELVAVTLATAELVGGLG